MLELTRGRISPRPYWQQQEWRPTSPRVSPISRYPCAFQPGCSRHAARLFVHASRGLVLYELRALAAELIGEH
ncbi:hypothetical protein E4195_22135 [Pseudomonas putida]|nr:hypothetical protein E4195_22135 [Pseudomonas putida]